MTKNSKIKISTNRNFGIVFFVFFLAVGLWPLLNGNEITNKHWDFFYECYLLTTGKKWGSSYLTKNFFKEIGKQLASKILLIVAFKDNQMIASALNFISDSCLYGRLWGTIKYIPYLSILPKTILKLILFIFLFSCFLISFLLLILLSFSFYF